MAARWVEGVAGTVLFSNMVSAIVLSMLDIVVGTAAACNIARIDADSFSTSHLSDPVIITGIVERWPAYHAWATYENATASLAGIRLSAPAAWDYAHDGVSHGESTSSSGRDVAVRPLLVPAHRVREGARRTASLLHGRACMYARRVRGARDPTPPAWLSI